MTEIQDKFPELLEYVSPDEKVVETLGWQFGTWGGYLLVASVWLFAQKDTPVPFSVGVLLLGLLMIYYETRRWKNRTALCVRGARLGIYRKGKLDMEVTRGNIILYQTSFLNTIRFAMLPLMGAIIAPIQIAQYFTKGDSSFTAMDLMATTALSVASLSSMASLFGTRHVCEFFRLPRKKGSDQDFCVARALAGRVTGQ